MNTHQRLLSGEMWNGRGFSNWINSMFVVLIYVITLMSLNTPNGLIVMGEISSMGEPDWSIAKADLVQLFYSYEPYETGRGFLSFGQGQQADQGHTKLNQQQPYPGPPGPVFFQPPSSYNNNNNGNSARNYLPPPQPAAQALLSPSPQIQSPTPNKEYSGNPSETSAKIAESPSPPKYTKFSMRDKRPYPHSGYPPSSSHLSQLIDITSKPIGPVYEHATQSPRGKVRPQEPEGGYKNPASTSVDSQTIIWPKTSDEKLVGDEEAQVRFLVHKAGDEEVIRSALLEDGHSRNEEVKFIEGPALRIQRHQKVYLPPKKKTVVYILLKEPQILTDVEVVGPTADPAPEVFITYQKSDGAIKTKHYSPEVVKNDKYLSQLRSSAASAVAHDYQSNGGPLGAQDHSSALQEGASNSAPIKISPRVGEGRGQRTRSITPQPLLVMCSTNSQTINNENTEQSIETSTTKTNN